MKHQKISKTNRGASCGSGCGALLLLLLCLAAAGVVISYTAAESEMHRQILKKYPPPGRMVDVGGYSLHLYCLGKGSPTVVVDVQWSDSTANWRGVQSLLARSKRTCLFDRAGRAWSDPSPRPRQIQVLAEELHSTLSKAGITSNYILLGEGEAGIYGLFYARQYPDELHGLVLATPTLYDPPQDWAGYSRINYLKWIMTAPFDTLTWLTSKGDKFFALQHECDLSYSAEICNLDNIWTYDKQGQQAVSAELELWDKNNAVLDNAAINLGNLPLVAIYPEKFYGEASSQKLNALLKRSTHATSLGQSQTEYRDKTPDAIVKAVDSLSQ